MAKATVFTGLPAKGTRTTKVPHRIGHLRNSDYEIFDRLFSWFQSMVDAIFILDGHALFQYWEIPCDETDPHHGRWVNMHTDSLFRQLDPHFDGFPYLFDFNEPLFPNSEVVAKRHNLLQVVIDGEPTAHSCTVYDLKRDLFAIASPLCNRKIEKLRPDPQFAPTAARTCLGNFKRGPYGLCILHFAEVCALANCAPGDVIRDPERHGRAFALAAGVEGYVPPRPTVGRGSPSPRPPNAGESPTAQREAEEEPNSLWGKIVEFFRRIFW
jgi:hypothetical protein